VPVIDLEAVATKQVEEVFRLMAGVCDRDGSCEQGAASLKASTNAMRDASEPDQQTAGE